MTHNIIANRYEVQEQLGAGGMGAVWLVRDKLRHQHVALKQVLMSSDEQRFAITREFRTLSTLRHPNIVSVIEYGFHESQPYFTMEYLSGAVPFDSAEPRIEHFIQMLQALGYLHRRGILHRDLKPGNVLIMPDGTVKLLDFGLSLDMVREKSGATGGTLPYMAPELFSEEPASVGSDLWALGIMLCEALLKRHPFGSAEAITELLMSIISSPPDLSGMDSELALVVERLLLKNPTGRYASTLDVIRDLASAARISLPPETQAQRESFLQAAAFVGRDAEYQCLVDALKLTEGGARQLWLIGGEAGVGKSRLLDEVRTRALVDGFAVLQGQAVEGGGLPYQIWRDPARKLVLGAPMQDLTASVLKELVPDIGILLEREVTDLPALEPKANRDRLMAAILERLRVLVSPVLIILEDLHWANEGLQLLKLLVQQLEGLPVMVIGSFRNDERPNLPQELPEARLLAVERLTPEAVAALSASMIGAENATPQLVERLASETEGNALFMVEVMRALAEEAGSLQGITHQSLPKKILAGGVVAVLRRRLEKVPAWALETLKLAAVIGRVVDLDAFKAAGVENIANWLQACADAAVLEPYQGEWRFSHDRLRQVLLQDLTDLTLLHEKAALALEAVYPGDVNYAEALAHHWRMAGNPEREVIYILKAAEYLVSISADYARAEMLLQRGLELNLPHTRAELLLWLGNKAKNQGQWETALNAFHSALAAGSSLTVQAALLTSIGEVYWRQSDFTQATHYAKQAQAVAERGGDQRILARNLNNLGNIAADQGDNETARIYYEDSLRIVRQIDERKGIAGSLNNLGTVAMFQGDYGAARSFYEDSLRIKRDIGDRQGIATSLSNLGIVALYQGDYQASRAYYEESLRIRREIGDQQGIGASLINLSAVAMYQEDYTAARTYHEESVHTFREIGDRRGVAISLETFGSVALLEGDDEAARQAYLESSTVFEELGNRDMLVSSASGLVMALARLGEHDAARERLVQALGRSLEIDAVPILLTALLGAAYWTEDQTRAAAWIGLMVEQATTEITYDPRFKRLSETLRAALGDKAFNAACERGKTLDVRAEVERLLAELTQ